MLNRLLVLMYMCLTNQAIQAHQKAREGEEAVEGGAEGKDVLLGGESTAQRGRELRQEGTAQTNAGPLEAEAKIEGRQAAHDQQPQVINFVATGYAVSFHENKV